MREGASESLGDSELQRSRAMTREEVLAIVAAARAEGRQPDLRRASMG